MGVAFDSIREAQVAERVLQSVAAGEGGMIVTPNLDHLRRSWVDPGYRALIGEADLVLADGMPLVWAARIQGTPLPERVAGSSLVLSLAEAAAGAGRSLFLLGGDPGAAEGAARELRSRFPKLTIAGCHCPPFGFEKDQGEMQQIRAALQAARPDIVYVGLGSPKQEQLIGDLRSLLPRAWWIGIGISLSFLSGDVVRAPGWMQRIGLEWVHRLGQEPGRLAKRYLVHGLPFALRLLATSAWRRFVPSR
jgi:N-acetylglucosaminyldiphosphoundecaprenol N-acetyl-beta-D-mannosaminyltransferase